MLLMGFIFLTLELSNTRVKADYYMLYITFIQINIDLL